MPETFNFKLCSRAILLIYFLILIYQAETLNLQYGNRPLFDIDDDSNETESKYFQDVLGGFSNTIKPPKGKNVELPDDSDGIQYNRETTTRSSRQQASSSYHEMTLVIEKINSLRGQHGSPPLRKDAWFDKQAEQHAKSSLTNNKPYNPMDPKGMPLGKNVYTKIPTSRPIQESEVEPLVLDALDSWYNENEKYDYQNPFKNIEQTRNFTNLIWKCSTTFGLGFANSTQKFVIVAVFFPPADNKAGFAQNVGRIVKKDEKKKAVVFEKMMRNIELYL